jgi:tRNA threonylcarbamoyladenosine biosynthesis protein TsaE
MKYLTYSAGQTRKRGKDFAKNIFPEEKALLIGLKGDLGGGKTTFLQGFAKGLGIKERVLSPTFVIMRKFKIQNSKFKYFYHIDCYRIKDSGEILALGFNKIISDPQNIIAIEWAGRIKKILPRNTLMLEFEFIDKNTRKITVKPKNNSEQKLIKASFKLNKKPWITAHLVG